MDLHEDTEKNLVTATFELPGLTKENVQIDVKDHVLSVSGESTVSSDRDDKGYSVRERRFGKFSRSLPLPQGIKVSLCFCVERTVQCANACRTARGNQGVDGERCPNRDVPSYDAGTGSEEDYCRLKNV